MRNLINILTKFIGSWNSGVICLNPFFFVGLTSCLDTNVKKNVFNWGGGETLINTKQPTPPHSLHMRFLQSSKIT